MNIGRFAYVFIMADPRLPISIVKNLFIQSSDMYAEGEEQRDINEPTYVGRIVKEPKYVSLGAFGGYNYKAYVETEEITTNISFLVRERINPHLN